MGVDELRTGVQLRNEFHSAGGRGALEPLQQRQRDGVVCKRGRHRTEAAFRFKAASGNAPHLFGVILFRLKRPPERSVSARFWPQPLSQPSVTALAVIFENRPPTYCPKGWRN